MGLGFTEGVGLFCPGQWDGRVRWQTKRVRGLWRFHKTTESKQRVAESRFARRSRMVTVRNWKGESPGDVGDTRKYGKL